MLSAVDFEVDGRRLPLRSLGLSFPDLGAMRRGEGTILLHSGAVMPSQSAGAAGVWLLAGIAAMTWTWRLLTERARSGLSLWPTWPTSPGANSPPS